MIQRVAHGFNSSNTMTLLLKIVYDEDVTHSPLTDHNRATPINNNRGNRGKRNHRKTGGWNTWRG